MTLIAISGYAQSGKDTLADILSERVAFERIAFADKLRECVQALNPIITYKHTAFNQIELLRYNDLLENLGYEQAKSQFPEFRAVLQRMGTEAGRKVIDDNVWVKATLEAMDPEKNYIVTDCRFPNEAAAIEAAGGTVVRVERLGTEPVNAHESETALDDWDFGWRIGNHGTLEEFAAAADSLLELMGVEVD